MVRFLLIAIVFAVAVFAVLHFTGFDVMGRLTGSGAHDVAARSLSPSASPHFTTNIVTGIISGLIVAMITGLFSRR